MEPRILIVDDNPLELQQLEAILEQNSYAVEMAENGEEALRLLENGDYDILITDIIMPKMNGVELIQEIKKRKIDILILVTSSINQAAKVIDIMKLGIQDYIIKPIDREEFIYKFQTVIEIYNSAGQRDGKKDIQNRSVEDHTKKVFEWNLWKEQNQKRDENRYQHSLFYNIKTNFCQGAGVGTLISLLSMVLLSEKNDDKYIVDANVMELVKDNYEIAKKFLDELAFIADIDYEQHDMNMLSVNQIKELVKDAAMELLEFTKKRKKKIKISTSIADGDTKNILANSKLLKWAMVELLRNAVKYSLPESMIKLEITLDKRHLLIGFLNQPKRMISHEDSLQIRGIPLDFEKIIFEPFFRISNISSDEFENLEMGMGLSAVKRIITKHKGNIKGFNQIIAGESQPELWVRMLVELPLL